MLSTETGKGIVGALMVSVRMQIALIPVPLESLPLVPAEVMDGRERESAQSPGRLA